MYPNRIESYIENYLGECEKCDCKDWTWTDCCDHDLYTCNNCGNKEEDYGETNDWAYDCYVDDMMTKRF